MRFAMMTYTMARQGFKVPDIIRTAAALNMDGIDWVTTYGEDPSELKKQCDAVNLTVAAHTFFLRKLAQGHADWRDEARASIADAVALGAPVVMIPPMPFPDIADPAENRRRWTDALAQVLPLAADAQITLSVENFPGSASAFVTAEDFLRVHRELPELRLTFDNGNAATGEDPLESQEKCRDLIVHVHLKDWQCRTAPHDGFRKMRDGRFYQAALIGEGVVDSRATLRKLAADSYSGFINIEYEGDQYPADLAIAKVLQYLRS